MLHSARLRANQIWVNILNKADGVGFVRRRQTVDKPTHRKVEDKLLAVDRDLWKKEVEEMKEFYKQFGDKLPDGLKQELADLEARLG